nr:phosphoserine phosphatase SerB [Actibacterium sp. 188UL27-1]
MIAGPDGGPSTAGSVDALHRSWGAKGGITWLAPDAAARFVVPDVPPDFQQAWERRDAEGIDLVITPVAAGSVKKLLLADMDSTMIGQECIDELADEAGVGDRVAGITARAMNGELDFDAALRERVGLLKGLDVDVIARVLAERITLAPGAATLIATMRARGCHTALVSGGFTAFTEAIAGRLGMDEHRANILVAADGVLTGKVGAPILGADAKVRALAEIRDRLGLEPVDVIAVGDGANDLPMLKIAGLGVAAHAKPAVRAQSPIQINHADLTALLYLQGIPKAAFVEM